MARHQALQTEGGPDSVKLGDEKIIFPAEDETMAKTDSRVGMNEFAVVSLALYGAQDRVENLYRQTRRTVKRLKLDAAGAEPFKTPPEGQGSQPNIHDVTRWLDGIGRTRKFKKERQLLK